ncbi:MAG: response regulator transcription factor [Salinivirgaceae bacterium]|nr:response regulator transcription factor [Salinivirgaceae bacterium]
MDETKTHIILVDDNVQFRANLKNYIEKELNCQVITEASDGVEFLKLQNKNEADIILMDIAMQEMDGFEATKRALWQNFHLKIIAITMHTEKMFLAQLLETGFKGCVFKSDVFKQLPIALKTVLEGKLFFPEGISI